MKCSICNLTVRKNQQSIGTMHEKCHAKFTHKPDLYEHQQQTKKLLQGRQHRVFDASDPGTGKTRPAIEAWVERKRRGGGKALVIAVKSNLESVWIEEINKWAPDVVPSVAYAKNRQEAFDIPADIYITNTDAVKWLAKQKKPFFDSFDTIIVDESSYFKHRTSARSKALIKIKDYFKYRECLSGTPMSNGICDLWNQVLFLDDGAHLGTNFWKFRQTVCEPVQVGPDRLRHVSWIDKPFAEEAVIGLISTFFIRHDMDECTSIPKNQIRRLQYTLPPKLMARYLQLEATAYLKLDKDAVTGTNAAVLRSKLFQMCSGAVYTTGENYEVLDDERYKIVADLIAERDHSVCFFTWRHQRDLLLKELTTRKISHTYLDGTVSSERMRTQIMKDYERGKYQTILIHPKTGAHGFNQLVRARYVIWPSPIYESDLFKQGNHRVRRTGQKSKTETIVVTAKRTVEDIVYASRLKKQTKVNKFFDILKESHDLH